MTNREVLEATAKAKGWNHHTSLEVVLEWLDHHVNRLPLIDFIGEIANAKHTRVGVAPPDATLASEVTTAAQQATLAEIGTYFDKDLTERALRRLRMLDSYLVSEIVIPLDRYRMWVEALNIDGRVMAAMAASSPGTIVDGCYAVLFDRTKVALAITRGSGENEFYADVFCIPAAELPPMSAPPRNSIAGLFTFSYSSGLNYNVRFRPEVPE